MGGLLLQYFLYAQHTIVIPYSCGIFVYKLVTSIDTKIVSCETRVFFIKFKI